MYISFQIPPRIKVIPEVIGIMTVFFEIITKKEFLFIP